MCLLSVVSFIYYLSLPSVLAKEEYVLCKSPELQSDNGCGLQHYSSICHPHIQNPPNIQRVALMFVQIAGVPEKKLILLLADLFHTHPQFICINTKQHVMIYFRTYLNTSIATKYTKPNIELVLY